MKYTHIFAVSKKSALAEILSFMKIVTVIFKYKHYFSRLHGITAIRMGFNVWILACSLNQ